MATIHTFLQDVWAQPFSNFAGAGGRVTYITQTREGQPIAIKYLEARADTRCNDAACQGPYPVTIWGNGSSVTFTVLNGDTFSTLIQAGGYGVLPQVTLTHYPHAIPLPATIGLFAIFLIALLIRPRRA